jgi:hypothetical protein
MAKIFYCGGSSGRLGMLRAVIPVADLSGVLSQSRNGVTVLDTRDVAPKQPGALFDVALAKILLFTKFAESGAYQHAGIISFYRLEGKQGQTGRVESEVLNASTSCYIRAPSPAHGGSA